MLIGKGAPLNEKNNNGNTPAHCSALSGTVEIMELMRKAGADMYERGKLLKCLT